MLYQLVAEQAVTLALRPLILGGRAGDTPDLGQAGVLGHEPDRGERVAAGEFKRTGGGIGYTPAGGVTGAAEIQYVLIDEDGKGDTSNPATETINVLNGAPKAMNQGLAADEGGTITGTLIARDPEGDPLTFRVFDGSGPGPVRLVLDERTGEFSFGPVNQPGRYSFRFIAGDGSHDSNTATVTIDVKPAVQEPPPTQEPSTTRTTGTESSATTTTTRRPQAGRSSGGSSGPR